MSISGALQLIAKHQVSVSFDETNPRASAFASTSTATLISQVNDETKQSVRAIIRKAFDKGIPPRTAARQIRSIVGLTTKQAEAVIGVESELAEKGFDDMSARRRRMIRRARAVREAKAGDLEGVTSKLRSKAIRRRAENIARTETIRSANAGQNELWEQAAEQGMIDRSKAEREWIVTPDDRLDLAICAPMAAQRAKLGQPFTTGAGTKVNYPPAHPGCRCATGLVTGAAT